MIRFPAAVMPMLAALLAATLAGENQGALVFELSGSPAPQYGAARRIEADRDLAELISDLPAVRYDAALGRAAREVAAFHHRTHQLAPSGLLAFLLDAAGAVEWNVQQAVLTLPEGSDRQVREAIKEMAEALPRGSPRARVGLAEVRDPGPPARREVTVLLSASGLEVEAVPTSIEAGGRAVVAFRLPALWDRPEVLALTPSLELFKAETVATATGYRAEVPAGSSNGLLSIEVLAHGPGGPSPLGQLAVWVGGPPPRVYRGAWPPDESHIPNHEKASDLVFDLVNQDRAGLGLPALERDTTLDHIARAHSRDMRDNAYVGHDSPTTGEPKDRLIAGRCKTVAHGENVARDTSLYQAETQLLRSLGHRRNILSRDMTRLGIGVSLRVEDGTRVWYLTQLFARPAERVEPPLAEAALAVEVGRAREARGVRGLQLEPALGAIAREEAERSDPTPQHALESVRSRTRTEGAFWGAVLTLPTLPQFVVPEAALAPDAARLGIGVAQDWTRDPPLIRVVILAGE